MPLTDRQLDLIQDSFHALRDDPRPKSIAFYDALFERAPDLRAMFRDEDLGGQGMRFMSTLAAIVDNLHDPTAMERRYTDLGMSHKAMGVTAQNFKPMGEALLDTLANTLGEDFTPEMRDAWTRAYAEFSREIIDKGSIPQS